MKKNMRKSVLLIVFSLFSLSYLNAAPKRQTSPSPATKAENRDDSPARAVDEKPAAKPANGDWGEEDELTEFLEKKAAEEDDTVIVIKTNVSRADIYLNGIYRGQSDLSLKNLRPGTYSLRVEKKGYETVRRRIRVRAGKEIVYHIDMQKLYGFLRINNNVPSMKPGEVAADSSITKMDIGYHSLHYTRFGYYDVNKNVEIFPYLTTDIQVVFSPCPFEVSAFSASSKKINPFMKGGYSSIRFSYNVTANGATKLVITDEYGAVRFTKEFSGFTHRSQSYTYDGRDNYGIELNDGRYKATLEADGKSFSQDFIVDSTITFSLISMETNGLSIGDVATGSDNMGFQFSWYNAFTPLIALNNASRDPFYFGWSSNLDFLFARHFEICMNMWGYPNSGWQNEFAFGVVGKFFNSIPLYGNNSILLGALVRVADAPVRIYSGDVDEKNGIGGGLFATVRTPGLNVGVDASMMYDGCMFMKAGLGLQYSITDRACFNASASYMHGFGLAGSKGNDSMRFVAGLASKGVSDIVQFDTGVQVTYYFTGEVFVAPKSAVILVF